MAVDVFEIDGLEDKRWEASVQNEVRNALARVGVKLPGSVDVEDGLKLFLGETAHQEKSGLLDFGHEDDGLGVLTGQGQGEDDLA